MNSLSYFEIEIRTVSEFAAVKTMLAAEAAGSPLLDNVLRKNILVLVGMLNSDLEIDKDDDDISIHWDDEDCWWISVAGSTDESHLFLNFYPSEADKPAFRKILRLFKHKRRKSTWRVNMMSDEGALIAEVGYSQLHEDFFSRGEDATDFSYWRRQRSMVRWAKQISNI